MKVLKRVLSVVVSVFVVCLSLSACGSKSGTNASSTLNVGVGADPRGLDPALADDAESARVTSNIYEGLVKFAKDSVELEPCLAKSWEISDDNLSYTFNLRDGVKFHDGLDFDAEAVKVNIERQLPGNATEDMAYAETTYGLVKGVEVVDKYTVKINLKTACTPFLNNMAMAIGAPMVSPRALAEHSNNLNENPVGTGPYKFVRWDKGQNVVLVKNDDYWGEKAKTDNLIFKVIPDNSARAVALTNGEVDIITNIDVNVVDQIKNGGCKLVEKEGMNVYYLAFNLESSICKNQEVRKALSQAINVPEMTQTVNRGYASPATSILPTFVPGYDSSIQQPSFDADAAKKMLESKGITEIHMITHAPAGQPIAEAVQGYMSKIGINLKIDSYDWTTYKSKILAGDYDMCYYGWLGDNGDPDNFLNILSTSDRAINVSHYNNPLYNSGIIKGLSLKNSEERNKVYTDLEKLQASDSAMLPLWHKKALTGIRANVNNFSEHPTGTISFKDVTKS